MLLALVACRSPAADDEVCRCTPSNVSTTKSIDEAMPMDGAALVSRLRRHQRYLAEGKNPRAIKVYDDELRFAVLSFCQPCGAWVGDRMTIAEMFPLARLDEATRAVCMGLVLRDGTTVYGDARPPACR